MFNDQRLYKGEKTQQDHKAMESISDKREAQNDWPRKHFQMDKKEPYESAIMCCEILDDSEQPSKKRKTHAKDAETNNDKEVTEFRQPLQVQSHLEMPRILVQLGHTQRT